MTDLSWLCCIAQFFVPLRQKVEFIPLPYAPRTPAVPAKTDRR